MKYVSRKCMLPARPRHLHVACLYLACHLGFPKLVGGGNEEGERRLDHLCWETIIQNLPGHWQVYLVKGTLTSVRPRTKSQTLLYHVKCLLAYLRGTSSLLSRKGVTTDSVTRGSHAPKVVPT